MRLSTPALLLGLAVTVPLFSSLPVPPDGNDDADSVALWDVPGWPESFAFVTDKVRNRIELHHVASGAYLMAIGKSGSGPGQFQRPNGIALGKNVPATVGTQDVLFIVERDNNRVSMFACPSLVYQGSFGNGQLDAPYGIATCRDGESFQVWVTSTGSSPDRVFVYAVTPQADGLAGSLVRSFPTPGATLESIVIDPVWRRAIVCDEGGRADVMVFDLQGDLLQRFGAGLFVNDPEGLVLYDLGDGEGYFIITDQNATPTEFEVFDRRTFASLGRFSGPTQGTDGVALTQLPRTGLPHGAFVALHNNHNVHVYDWGQIAGALGLRTRNYFPPTDAGQPRDEPQALRAQALWSSPNPANPAAQVRYRIDAPSHVLLEVFDSGGHRIATLVNGLQPAGEQRITWYGRDAAGRRLPSGVYLARLRTGARDTVHKMLLVD